VPTLYAVLLSGLTDGCHIVILSNFLIVRIGSGAWLSGTTSLAGLLSKLESSQVVAAAEAAAAADADAGSSAAAAAAPYAAEAALGDVALLLLSKSSFSRQREFAAEIVRQLGRLVEQLRRAPPLPVAAAVAAAAAAGQDAPLSAAAQAAGDVPREIQPDLCQEALTWMLTRRLLVLLLLLLRVMVTWAQPQKQQQQQGQLQAGRKLQSISLSPTQPLSVLPNLLQQQQQRQWQQQGHQQQQRGSSRCGQCQSSQVSQEVWGRPYQAARGQLSGVQQGPDTKPVLPKPNVPAAAAAAAAGTGQGIGGVSRNRTTGQRQNLVQQQQQERK